MSGSRSTRRDCTSSTETDIAVSCSEDIYGWMLTSLADDVALHLSCIFLELSLVLPFDTILLQLS